MAVNQRLLQLESALQKAHALGNTEHARVFAEEIQRLRQAQGDTPAPSYQQPGVGNYQTETYKQALVDSPVVPATPEEVEAYNKSQEQSGFFENLSAGLGSTTATMSGAAPIISAGAQQALLTPGEYTGYVEDIDAQGNRILVPQTREEYDRTVSALQQQTQALEQKKAQAMAENIPGIIEAQRKAQEVASRDNGSWFSQLGADIGGSLPSILPAAGAVTTGTLTGIATKNPVTAAAAAKTAQTLLATVPAMQAYSNAYIAHMQKYPDAPESEHQAYAAAQASVEFGSEALFPGAGAASSVIKTVGKRVGTEVLSENVAALGGSGVDLVMAPELAPKSWMEQLEAQRRATLASLVMSGGIAPIGASQATADFNAAKNPPPPVVAPTPTGDSAIDAGQAAAAAISQQASALGILSKPQAGPASDITTRRTTNLPMTWAPGVDLDTPRGEVSPITGARPAQEIVQGATQPTRNLPMTWARGVDLDTPRGAVSDIRTRETSGFVPAPVEPIKPVQGLEVNALSTGQAKQADLGLAEPTPTMEDMFSGDVKEAPTSNLTETLRAQQESTLSQDLASVESQRKAIQARLTETMTRKERKALTDQATSLIAKENEIKRSLAYFQQEQEATPTQLTEQQKKEAEIEAAYIRKQADEIAAKASTENYDNSVKEMESLLGDPRVQANPMSLALVSGRLFDLKTKGPTTQEGVVAQPTIQDELVLPASTVELKPSPPPQADPQQGNLLLQSPQEIESAKKKKATAEAADVLKTTTQLESAVLGAEKELAAARQAVTDYGVNESNLPVEAQSEKYRSLVEKAAQAEVRLTDARYALGRFARLQKRGKAHPVTPEQDTTTKKKAFSESPPILDVQPTQQPTITDQLVAAKEQGQAQPQTGLVLPMTRAERVAQAKSTVTAVPPVVPTTRTTTPQATGQAAPVVAPQPTSDTFVNEDTGEVERLIPANDPERLAVENAIEQAVTQGNTRAVRNNVAMAVGDLVRDGQDARTTMRTILLNSIRRNRSAGGAIGALKVMADAQKKTNHKLYDAPEGIDRVIASLENHPMLKNMKLEVVDSIDNLPDDIKNEYAKRNNRVSGLYSADNDTLYLSGDVTEGALGGRFSTVVHELVHATTLRALNLHKAGKLKDRGLVKATQNFQEVYDQFLKRTVDFKDYNIPSYERGAIAYARSDINEFLTMSLTSPEFRSATKGVGLWRQIKDAVRRILRLPQTDQELFDTIIERGLDLIEATRKGEAALQQEWASATGKGVNNTPDQTVRDTINVDGVERPRTNSNGQPIEVDDEKLRNFWRWFGDSKVVDAEGSPLVVYHGTKGIFDAFDTGKQGRSDFGASGRGFYFSQDPGSANLYANLSPGDGAPNIMPVYVALLNPYEMGALLPQNETQSRLLTERLKAEGYDGIIVRGADGVLDEIVAFRPEQIKSAIGNKGTYDPQNPSIVADVTIAQEAKVAKSALQSSVASATRGIASVALPNQGVDTGVSDFSARLAGNKLVNDRKMIGLINKGYGELESVPLSERPALNDKMTKALRGEKQTLPDEAAKTVKMVREHLDDLSTQLLIELKAAYAGKPIPESELAKMKAIAKERGKYLSRVYDIDFGKMKGNHLLDAYAAGKPTAVARVKPALDHLTSKAGSLPQRIAEAKAEADRRNQEEPLSGNQKWTTKDVWEMVGDKSTIKSYYTDIIGSPAGKSQDTMLSELEEAAKGINPDTAKDIAMQIVADLVGASEQSKSKSGSRGEYYQGLRARDAAMKSRSDMPPWLRNLWGEVNDFISVSAITAARITDVTASVRLGNQLMEESPHLFSDSRPTDKDWVQVGGSSPSAIGLYGKVAGKWAPPEVAALLNGAFNPNGAFELSLENLTKNPLGWAGTAVSKAASKVTGALKSSLIKWNPAPWVFNLGNFVIIPLNNGNFNPAYLKEASEGMGYLLGTAYKKAKDLTDKQKPVAALLDEALRQGVVDPVMVRTDDEVRLAERERQAMVDAGPVEGKMQRISRGWSNVSNTVTEGVNFLETTPKLANFYYWLDVMAKTEKYKGLGLDHKKIGQMLADGTTTRQVRLLIREAAIRTSENNISYNKVPKIVKATEKGLLGSFVNFYFESMRAPIRSALNGVKDLKSGDPALKAAGFRSLVGGTMGMLTTPALHMAAIKTTFDIPTVIVGGLLSTIGDEEDEEKRKDLEAVLRTSLAYSEGNSRALVDVDENGNVWVTDTGRADTYDTWHSLVKSNLDAAYMFANGEEDAAIEKAKDTFTGVFSNFLGGSLVGGLASDVVTDRNRKLFFEDAFPETADRLEEYFGKGANNLINLITPGVAKGLIKGAGTPEDAPTAIKVLNFFNAPLNKIDTLRGVGAVAGRLSGDRRDAMEDLVESVASVDEVKEDRLAAAVDTYRGAYLETWKELRDQVEAAQAAFRLGGVPPRIYNPRIRQAILDVYSNNKVADSVMSGKFFIPPLSDEAFVRGVEEKKALIKDRANAEELLLRLKAREKFVRDYYKEIKVEQPN